MNRGTGRAPPIAADRRRPARADVATHRASSVRAGPTATGRDGGPVVRGWVEGGRRRGDSNSRGVLSPTFLAGRRTRPLCDVSIPGSTGGGGSVPGAGPGGQTARRARRAPGPGERSVGPAGVRARGRAAGGSRWVPPAGPGRRAGRGEGGIRTPGAPGAQRFSRPPHSAALSPLQCPEGRTRPYHRRRAAASGRGFSPGRTGRRPRLSSGRGLRLAPGRRRRGLQPREKKPRRRVGWAVTGMREAGWSRRPSASAGPMAGQTGRREARVACRAW